MSAPRSDYDLAVIGGGINGAGIARDAAGRGLRVLLIERADLGGATSSASSKLIHGGLRYLEQYAWRLVHEALEEREILLSIASHLVWPARFVMPHVPALRPRWMIRAGLFLYDHLARRARLPSSASVRLDGTHWGQGLKAEFRNGFVYSDCRVDDARLVIANARSALALGATIRPRTELTRALREAGGWTLSLRRQDGGTDQAHARVLVNAAGPWVKQVLNARIGQPSRDAVRLVKGSHIVLPRRYTGEHAYILQNADRRVVFLIPYEEDYTLVGTTDLQLEGGPDSIGPAGIEPDAAEVEYLCRAANRYLALQSTPADVLWRYAGVRPLYDDGSSNPSAVTRDYTLRLDAADGAAPVLSVFGGKLTTYRRLAEQAMHRLLPCFEGAGGDWTSQRALPGSEFSDRHAARAAARERYPWLPESLLRGLFRRHGGALGEVLGDARRIEDLGEQFGAGAGVLTERELEWFVSDEWAETGEDVLWRRSKAGLRMDATTRERVARRVEALAARARASRAGQDS